MNVINKMNTFATNLIEARMTDVEVSDNELKKQNKKAKSAKSDDFIAYGEQLAKWADENIYSASELKKLARTKKIPEFDGKSKPAIKDALEVALEIMGESIITEGRAFTKRKWFDVCRNSFLGTMKGFDLDDDLTKHPIIPLQGYKILKSSGAVTKGYLLINYETGKFGIENCFIANKESDDILQWNPTADSSWNPSKQKILKLIGE